MPVYAALDVSKASTQVHVVDEAGTCLWRGKSLTRPEALAEALAPFAADLVKVGLETRCLSTWPWATSCAGGACQRSAWMPGRRTRR